VVRVVRERIALAAAIGRRPRVVLRVVRERRPHEARLRAPTTAGPVHRGQPRHVQPRHVQPRHAPTANAVLLTPRATLVRRLRGRHDPPHPPAGRPAASTGGHRSGRPSRVVALSGRPTKTGQQHGGRRVRPEPPPRGQPVPARIRGKPEHLASSAESAVLCRSTRRFRMTCCLPTYLERRAPSSAPSQRRPPTWSPATS